jgi:hypothetical protein
VYLSLGVLLLAAAVVVVLLQPLVMNIRAPMDGEGEWTSEADARRRVALMALRDVEYDFATGKLDDQDYDILRKEISAEALEALEELDQEETSRGPEALEAEIAAVRAGLGAGAACAACGYQNPEGSRFCSSCGGPLAVGAGTG